MASRRPRRRGAERASRVRAARSRARALRFDGAPLLRRDPVRREGSVARKRGPGRRPADAGDPPAFVYCGTARARGDRGLLGARPVRSPTPGWRLRARRPPAASCARRGPSCDPRVRLGSTRPTCARLARLCPRLEPTPGRPRRRDGAPRARSCCPPARPRRWCGSSAGGGDGRRGRRARGAPRRARRGLALELDAPATTRPGALASPISRAIASRRSPRGMRSAGRPRPLRRAAARLCRLHQPALGFLPQHRLVSGHADVCRRRQILATWRRDPAARPPRCYVRVPGLAAGGHGEAPEPRAVEEGREVSDASWLRSRSGGASVRTQARLHCLDRPTLRAIVRRNRPSVSCLEIRASSRVIERHSGRRAGAAAARDQVQLVRCMPPRPRRQPAAKSPPDAPFDDPTSTAPHRVVASNSALLPELSERTSPSRLALAAQAQASRLAAAISVELGDPRIGRAASLARCTHRRAARRHHRGVRAPSASVSSVVERGENTTTRACNVRSLKHDRPLAVPPRAISAPYSLQRRSDSGDVEPPCFWRHDERAAEPRLSRARLLAAAGTACGAPLASVRRTVEAGHRARLDAIIATASRRFAHTTAASASRSSPTLERSCGVATAPSPSGCRTALAPGSFPGKISPPVASRVGARGGAPTRVDGRRCPRPRNRSPSDECARIREHTSHLASGRARVTAGVRAMIRSKPPMPNCPRRHARVVTLLAGQHIALAGVSTCARVFITRRLAFQ